MLHDRWDTQHRAMWNVINKLVDAFIDKFTKGLLFTNVAPLMLLFIKGFPWAPMGSHGFSWVPMGSHEYTREEKRREETRREWKMK